MEMNETEERIDRNKVITGLAHCGFTALRGCDGCPYSGEHRCFGVEACVGSLTTDALKLLQEAEPCGRKEET